MPAASPTTVIWAVIESTAALFDQYAGAPGSDVGPARRRASRTSRAAITRRNVGLNTRNLRLVRKRMHDDADDTSDGSAPDGQRERASAPAAEASLGELKSMTTAVAVTIPVDGLVHDIALDPDRDRLYVAQTDSIVVINSQNEVVDRISAGGRPHRLAMDNDGSQLFVVDYGGSAFVVDTSDHTVRTLWEGGAVDVVVSPDGRYVYSAHRSVSDGQSHGAISVVEVASAAVVGTVSVSDVVALAIAPDGNRLYAVSCDRRTNYQYPTGWLAVIDSGRQAVVDTIAVGPCPESITASPDGTQVYVTHYDTYSVSAVNLATRSVTAITLLDAPLALSFTPDGARAYVRNVQSLTVIETATTTTEDVDAGELPRGLQFSIDGKYAYIADFGGGAVTVVDTITNAVTARFHVSGHPEAIAVSRGGERIYLGDCWSGDVAIIAVPPQSPAPQADNNQPLGHTDSGTSSGTSSPASPSTGIPAPTRRWSLECPQTRRRASVRLAQIATVGFELAAIRRRHS